MFTRKTKVLLQILYKDASGTPTEVKGSDIAELYDSWNKSDEAKFLDKLKQLTVDNTKNKNAILSMIDMNIRVSEGEGDRVGSQRAKEFKKKVEENYKRLSEEFEVEKRKKQVESMNKRAGLSESVESKDSNPRQAEAFTKALEKIRGNTGVDALLKAIKEGVKTDVGEAGVMMHKLNLAHVNMRGLIDFVLSGLNKDTYRSNGAFFLGDSFALSIFEPIYKEHKNALEPLFQELQAFYSAGQTSEDWFIARGKMRPPKSGEREAYTNGDIIQYFTTYREGTMYDFQKIGGKNGKSEVYQLVSDDRSFFTPYPKGELEGYFNKLQDNDLISRIKNIVRIGGGVIEGNTKEELYEAMMQNPSLRANYIRGLNFVAMTPNRGEYFRSGKLEVGVNAEKSTKLVELLKDKKNLEAIRKGLIETTGANKQAIEKNTALTPEQKNNILTGIDEFINKMDEKKLQSIAYDTSLTLTQGGVAIGGGATWEIGSRVADTVSLGGSVASDYKGSIGAAISLALTKELYQTNKADFGVHYGLLGAKGGVKPFIGVHGSYDDALASITKGPGFVNAFIGMRVGRNTDMIKNLEGLSGAQKEIYQLAARDNKGQISIKHLVNDPAIASRMDGTIQTLLKLNGYTAQLSQEEAYGVLYPAVIEAMNQEILLLRRESNDNGWVMKQIGINFGKLAGLTYVLPGFRIGRDDLITQVSVQSERVKVGVKENIINPTTLFGSAKFKDSTKEYSIPLNQDSKIRTSSTSLPGGAFWEFDNSGNVIGISGLKDYGIKVTEREGKYIIEYDTSKPVRNDKNVNGIQNKVPEVADFERESLINKSLSQKEFRMALSHLFVKGSSRREDADKFAKALQEFQIPEARGYLLQAFSVPRVLPVFKEMYTAVNALNPINGDPETLKKLQSMLFDLRGAMMMDEKQAKNIIKRNTSVEMKETTSETKKRFEEMLNHPKMKELYEQLGITSEDYKELILAKDSSNLSMTEPLPGVLGAVASLKTNDAYMARMPAGTMRFAQSGGQEFTKLINDSAKKSKVMDTIIPADSPTDKAYRSAIAKVLGIEPNDALAKVTREAFKSLVVEGKATIDNKVVTMSGQSLMLCAYGDCTNPGVAMKIGAISTPDIPGKQNIDITAIAQSDVLEEVSRYTTRTTMNSLNFSGALGETRSKGEPFDATTKPGVEEVKPETKPGFREDGLVNGTNTIGGIGLTTTTGTVGSGAPIPGSPNNNNTGPINVVSSGSTSGSSASELARVNEVKN